jgi:hypothetical protein
MSPSEYPVHYHVAQPARFTRLQLLVRVLAFLVLGIVGLSFGGAFFLAYVALPAFASIRLGAHDADAYLREDGPRIANVLHWFAAICAWMGLITDRLPAHSPEETVELEIVRSSHPTTGKALWRLLTGLPSAIALGVLGFIGTFVWLWAALSILVHERVGKGTFDFLVGLQRWALRLLAYQASLVDDYPPFSFGDVAPTALPPMRATS